MSTSSLLGTGKVLCPQPVVEIENSTEFVHVGKAFKFESYSKLYSIIATSHSHLKVISLNRLLWKHLAFPRVWGF